MPNAPEAERLHAEMHIFAMLAHGCRLAAETLKRYDSDEADNVSLLGDELALASEARMALMGVGPSPGLHPAPR
jgi:hypothetical protein